eukprot:6542101-Pyramimonas_sp.AAC.1
MSPNALTKHLGASERTKARPRQRDRGADHLTMRRGGRVTKARRRRMPIAPWFDAVNHHAQGLLHHLGVARPKLRLDWPHDVLGSQDPRLQQRGQ